MLCKHDWQKIDSIILDSAIEQFANINTEHWKGSLSFPRGAFTKKYILTIKCVKCGKIKTIVEENP